MSKKSPTYGSLLSHLVLSAVGPPRFSHQPYSFPSLHLLPLSFPSSSSSFLFGPSFSHPHRPKAAPTGVGSLSEFRASFVQFSPVSVRARAPFVRTGFRVVQPLGPTGLKELDRSVGIKTTSLRILDSRRTGEPRCSPCIIDCRGSLHDVHGFEIFN